MNVFGSTRSRITSNYALITPDTHVPSPLIGWENATAFVHISPELGARFRQYTALLTAVAKSVVPQEGVQRFIYVNEGTVTVDCAEAGKARPITLASGGFAYFPAGVGHAISTSSSARLTVLEKVFQPFAGTAAPRVIIGHEREIEAKPFLGDPDARLKTFLPIDDLHADVGATGDDFGLRVRGEKADCL